ncbi:MAG: DUF5678 domain-containing protein [Blastocatellia bacterium]
MEQYSYEQAVEIVSGLPPQDRQRLREWIDDQDRVSPGHQTPVPDPTPEPEEREARFRRALQWLHENGMNYTGQWIALDGDRLVAYGADGKQVYARAVAAGVKAPLLHRINESDNLPFGGW